MEHRKMSPIEKLCEQFLEMEADKNLFEELKGGDIKVWHYIRYEIYVMLLRVVGGYANPNWNKKNYEKADNLIGKVCVWIDEYLVKSQFRISPKDVLVFNLSRRVKQGKYYNCIYTDEWLKRFDKSYYVFEGKYENMIHFKPVQTKNLRYYDIGEYIRLFKKNYTYAESKKEIERVSKIVIQILEEEFGIKLPVRERKNIESIIRNAIVGREMLRDYFGHLLKKIQPKVIIYVVGYSLNQMIIAELAKEMGIPTIELQHGHIGRGSLPYNFMADVKVTAFPDYLFVNGEHELETARLPIPKENVYVVGSTELEKQRLYYAEKLKGKRKRRKVITFICSGEPEIADGAIELSRKLDKTKYKIYLKLHPSEYTNWKKKYPKLIDSDVNVVDGSKHDVYYYMAVSDWLIGITSTVLFEATRFNCNILVLRKVYYFNSESLVSTGNAVYIDTMDEAVEYISSNMPPRKESEYFYCGNSCQRIHEAIDDVLRRRKE